MFQIEGLSSLTALRMQSVSASEIPSLHQILVACGLDLQERLGLDYWVPPYPLEKMVGDLGDKRIYGVFSGEEAIATFTLETTMPPEYTQYGKIRWQVKHRLAMYVHRLAVLPSWQGRGLGTWCLQSIETLAAEQGCSAVRLDAVKVNRNLLAFYKRRGYRLVGELIYPPETLFNDAFVWEKVLTNLTTENAEPQYQIFAFSAMEWIVGRWFPMTEIHTNCIKLSEVGLWI